MKELDLNSDTTMGSVQNGIHCVLFWHEARMTVDANLEGMIEHVKTKVEQKILILYL